MVQNNLPNPNGFMVQTSLAIPLECSSSLWGSQFPPWCSRPISQSHRIGVPDNHPDFPGLSPLLHQFQVHPTQAQTQFSPVSSSWKPRIPIWTWRIPCPGCCFSVRDVLTWDPPAWGSCSAHPVPSQPDAPRAPAPPRFPKSSPVCPGWVKQKLIYYPKKRWER